MQLRVSWLLDEEALHLEPREVLYNVQVRRLIDRDKKRERRGQLMRAAKMNVYTSRELESHEGHDQANQSNLLAYISPVCSV